MELKLLDFTFDLFKDIDLSNILVISVQHLLKSNEIMFDYLLKLGLKPENTFILGKCYSSNLEVSRNLEKKGIFVHKNSFFYNSHHSFDKSFQESIIQFLKTIKSNKECCLEKYKKIILLDDGGNLIFLWESIFKKTNNVVGVEQTSSGFNKLKLKEIGFPVINVARSEVKLKYESPFIAEKVISNLNLKLNAFNLSLDKVLIIGGGSIGSSIYEILSTRVEEIDLFDTIAKKSKLTKEDFLSKLNGYNIIIGTTGEKLNYDFNKIGKKVLVSASSSDREFSAVDLRKKLPLNFDPFLDLKINNIYLLNSGFPINFNGKENSVAPELIQLTRSLIFSAVCFGIKENYNTGLIELNSNIQKIIIDKFKELN